MATEVIDRSAFIRRWRDRKGGEDPFDQFFSLWLALVICARPKLQPQDYDKMDTDRCAVLILAKEAHEAIFRELVSCKDELAWLAQRRGTRRKDPVVDVYDFRRAAHLRSLCIPLRQVAADSYPEASPYHLVSSLPRFR